MTLFTKLYIGKKLSQKLSLLSEINCGNVNWQFFGLFIEKLLFVKSYINPKFMKKLKKIKIASRFSLKVI